MSRFETGTKIDYKTLNQKLQVVQNRLQRPLTVSEKIVYSHLDDPEQSKLERGKDYIKLRPGLSNRLVENAIAPRAPVSVRFSTFEL